MNGAYVSVNFSESTKEKIKSLMDSHQIPNPLSTDKLHITLLYSRVPLKSKYYVEDFFKPIHVHPHKPEIFKVNDKNVLVITIESEWLNLKHRILREQHGGSHDYPSYVPHITLSYDVPDDFNCDIIQESLSQFGPLEIVNEHISELNESWKWI